MAIIYVDGLAGSDSNDGSSRVLAKATLAGSRAAYTAGQDLVLVRPTVYLEGNINFSSANDHDVLIRNDTFYAGLPIFDFEFRLDFLTGTFATNAYFAFPNRTKLLNLVFRDMASTAGAFKMEDADAWVMHCVFHNRAAGIGTTTGVGTFNGSNSNPFNVYNCTFLNILYPTNGEGTSAITYNCYAPDSTVINIDNTGPPTRDYNAYSTNSEPNGIDTDVTDPGVRSLTAPVDYRLDPLTTPADYEAFIQGGLFGGRIGAFGKGGIYYNNKIPQLRFLTPDPLVGNPNLAWENEGPGGTNTYTAGTPGDIIEDPATDALKIDLGAIPLATGGRVRSDVYDLGATGNPEFVNAAFSAFQDGPGGALIDTDTALPQKFEYRSSASSFLKGDGSPAWIEIEQKDDFSVTDRYIQFRVEFRTDHTNA